MGLIGLRAEPCPSHGPSHGWKVHLPRHKEGVMSRSLYVRGTKVEDGRAHELVIVDGVVAGAAPLPSREPDAVGWVVPGLADVHNHLSLASPAGDHEEPVIRVRASATLL